MSIFGGLFVRRFHGFHPRGGGAAFRRRHVCEAEELRRRLRHYVARREAVDAEFTMIEDDPAPSRGGAAHARGG